MNKLGILILSLILFSTKNAYAYLDPGTGSIILQAILGAIAAGISYCTFYWNKVKNFIKKIINKQDKTGKL